MAVTTELIVVRHGETSWNRQLRLQGQADSELSPLGLEQARALAERLAGEPFTVVVSSDLVRAGKTAQAIADRAGRTLRLDPGLRERHFGIFQGHTWDEIRSLYPADHEAYRRDPDFAPPGGGEAARDQNARVLRAFARIVSERTGERIVVVTHGGPLQDVFKHAVGLDFQSPRRFSLPNAALNVFTVTDGHYRLELWGDTRHLAGLDVRDDY
jgi:probable phosphoglycerate mutase